jgi:dihydrofolate reductase
MKLSLIAAVAENGVIGHAGDLAWRLPGDMKFFKQTTSGHHILMGRKTWESIGRPLPNRTMVVITRQPDYVADGCQVVDSLEAGVELARTAGETEAFVIGGAEIYALALPRADRLYLTRVHAEFEGDTVFPDFDPTSWTQTLHEPHPADDNNPYPYTFTVLERGRS